MGSRVDADREQIRERIFGMTIADSHEHLPYREDEPGVWGADFLQENLKQYYRWDLVSAGLPFETLEYARTGELSIMERWKIVEPYWEYAQNTGYGRAMRLSARDIYGIERIDRSTIEELDKRYREALAAGGRYRKVLKEKSKIVVSILDANLNCDRDYFRSVFRLHPLILPQTFADFERMEEISGVKATSFGSWLEIAEAALEYALEHGAVALKCALAYEHGLNWGEPNYAAAEREFNELLASRRQYKAAMTLPVVGNAFRDYMMHHTLKLANDRGLTYQFHTGYLSGSGGRLAETNPELMIPLLMRYPDVKFVLMHMAYPYEHTLGAIAKSFQNVFLDMCWAPILAPHGFRNALRDFLDTVPWNKIMTFGGDYRVLDSVYGHQWLVRDALARVLGDMITEGIVDVEEASRIASATLHDNVIQIFGITEEFPLHGQSAQAATQAV